MARTQRSRYQLRLRRMGPEPGPGISCTAQASDCSRSSGARTGTGLSKSFKHRDWARAKRQADEFAADDIVGPEILGGAEVQARAAYAGFTLLTSTVQTGDAHYGAGISRRDQPQGRDAGCSLGSSGRDRNPTTALPARLSQDHAVGTTCLWGGSARAEGPYRIRTVEQDLKLLLAMLNWAAKSRDEQGCLLLNSNPLQGLKTWLKRVYEILRARVVLVEEPNTWRFSRCPARSTGGFVSRSCSRTRRDSASVPAASFGGRTWTSKKEWCYGARSTRRPTTHTGRSVTIEAIVVNGIDALQRTFTRDRQRQLCTTR